MKVELEHTLAECRDAYPVPEVGSELEGLWGQAMCDPASVGAYVKACAVAQQKEIDALRVELEGDYKSIIEMGNMLTEIVNLIRGEPEEGTSHSTHDAVELVRGLAMHNDLYATAVELEVAKLKAEKDALLRQALDALEGFANITNDSHGVAGYHLSGNTAEWDEFDEVDAASSTIEAIRNHLGVKND